MNTEYTRKVLEAGLMAAGRTLSLAELGQLFDEVDRPDNEQLRTALAELGESWADRAFELKETAAGFRAQVRRDFAEQVSRLWPERPPRYSRALLETLAIVAYRQPITRGEIESVRGVAVNPNIVRTLFERNWIRVVGHREVPGRPELLGTTRDFLDYFGLKSLDQLPTLAEIKSLEELDPQLALPEPVGVALPAPESVGESANDEADPEKNDEPEREASDGEGPAGEPQAGEEQAAVAGEDPVPAEGEPAAGSEEAGEEPAAQSEPAGDAGDIEQDGSAESLEPAEVVADAESESTEAESSEQPQDEPAEQASSG